jgi:hypothetical protein
MKKKKQLTAIQTKENSTNLDNSTQIFDAISKMNLEALVAYIDEDINIDEDPCKYTLLTELKSQFKNFNSKGDTFLTQTKGKCLMCSYGSDTMIFTGNNSGEQYSLRYTVISNTITELYECNYCEGHHVKD